MAYNPFLSMNEPAAPTGGEVLNPFMMTDSEPAAFSNDNPFATSNPFSDFGGEYEPPAGDTVPVDIFGAVEPTGIGAKHFEDFPTNTTTTFDVFTSQPDDCERLVKPTELDLASTTADNAYFGEETTGRPMPPRPLPPETQNLILSVTGQMEFTSSHLLDRIPPTRTPSPVSVRDIHSPSPTPEPELEAEPVIDSFDINRNKPARPPPARPPPAARPPPPRPAPPPVPAHAPASVEPLFNQSQPQAQMATDDINLFDAPVPAPVKPTKEAILSLYSAPKKEEQPIDFLSDDIIDEVPADNPSETASYLPSANDLPIENPSTVDIQNDGDRVDTLFLNSGNPTMDSVAPMDCSEPALDNITPATVNSSPFAEVLNDDFQDRRLSASEKNPFEDSTIVDIASPFPVITGNIFDVRTEETIESTDAFGSVQAGVFDKTHANAVDTTQTNVFDTAPVVSPAQIDGFNSSPKDSQVNNGFGNVENAFLATQDVQPTDIGWGDSSEAMVQDAFPESQDAFDAFSAKFDSTGANHISTGRTQNFYP